MADLETPVLGTALVIGGCGLLGHHIVKILIESKVTSKIVVLDVNTAVNLVDGVEYINGSITSSDQVTQVLKQHTPRVVFHTVSPNPLSENRKRFYEVNVGGTQNLLECIKNTTSVKALVYTSSSSVVHNSYTDLIKATEDMPLFFEPAQKVYYSHTKAVAEQMVINSNRQNGLLTTVIRPASLFGEGDHLLTGNMVGLGRKNVIIGSGTNQFDFTYVGNNAYAQMLAAAALVRASTSKEPIPDDERVDGEAFVVTNDEPWPFWEFARALAVAAGYTVDRTKAKMLPKGVLLFFVGLLEWFYKILTLGTRQPAVKTRMILPTTLERTFNIGKAKKRLGYKPQVSIEEGISRTITWYMSQQGVQKKTA
ncbi:sterol-4-alpha-carboxylate 3-dehydrogenase [Lindgomyces ingoldianus]|uniref:Sterol-4-alpha-carboxylate 3-dehydrogenase n=1 Tax=Lindgomyces ingoldianus TaxID=673940 RepID=A0ACB6QQW0_9PLEO|nr:sterol-4-alpha-carboxylate 3-dehydrogenase [Lindgomyces ingoldianus]KAF2469383.1 sterol-4-alpha-carboxylate 3-dehydrogenase [Lindgomyces ingoldianus]